MDGQGKVVGTKAPDFSLPDQDGKTWTLKDALQDSALLLVFYPGDFTPVCTRQLCNYRDAVGDFKKLGVRVLGISRNSSESHVRFASKFDLPFPLLSDPEEKVAKAYGCTSWLMFGRVSRAVCIVSQKGIILFLYIEPTTLTRRKSEELVKILEDLRSHSLI